MNTRKVRAGMPAPQDIPWPEPEVISDYEEEMGYLGWLVFTLGLMAVGVLLAFMFAP